MTRNGGILLHPTSLPGPYGIGDLGPGAHRWIEFLDRAGCGMWQVLPLGPTGYGDSPYQTFSAVAGNPYLISPEGMVGDGLLDAVDPPDFPENRVDYGAVIPWKRELLAEAFERMLGWPPDHPIRSEFAAFRRANRDWLPGYTTFIALKETHDLVSWAEWPAEYRDREPEAIRTAEHELADRRDRVAFEQFVFFRQWERVRVDAHQRGIQIIGDIPIFVAHDSADVWANRHLFSIDGEGQPSVVAGVPPDYFSETGQLWGNPLYRWSAHRRDGYQWWIKRVRATLDLVDIVRLDHFRGFYDYWEIPGDAETAIEGRWRRGPGGGLLGALRRELGELPLIAEDLGGDMGPGVARLRERFGLPGMKVTQFAFGSGPDHEFLPHNYDSANWVAYTGTHDNDTVQAWLNGAADYEREYALRYAAATPEDFHWALLRLTWSSIARIAVAPLQDFLGLGEEGRMNVPSVLGGNWQWRAPAALVDDALADQIRSLNETYGRLPA
ncbi:MAG: 4-alpha-glucanotransferase [Acidimicrobiia bacterium]|nr:4-alpha-glucanotransferase [Acidimicrobiia bacterium]MBT8193284.1 4-alpha-glucanotransferase [Acidimicrobiia bacterium]MBT8246474.1 4-alpha-glucanotransferase [Acidimicrobiia bacterium]NNJ46445.1 4-alpha-glucanotransferase [Acidimicrobiia bacterium]NNL13557.1 4-alpha-glucanotransferase [Acidimicrobiia bacterium]